MSAQQAINEANKLKKSLGGISDEAKDADKTIDSFASKIGNTMASMGVALSATALVKNIVQVRGEFQQLEVALKTMLGSAEKADALLGQLTQTAATTPFDLQSVAQGAKQLLAYGTASEDVNETLVRLGDIAAGLSIPLGDLVYLYGTTMTQGRMFTQDLRQFMGRGIPIAKELAKQFGVVESKIGDMVTAGKVGAEEVKKAIWSMTDAGSQFGGLMEAQSKTIGGQISNIGDSIQTMFNEIGKSSEGIINESLSVVSALVENYEKVGKVLLTLVSIYGAYRTAVMLVAAGATKCTIAETAHYGALVLAEKAQKLLNKTMLANPYVLAATAIAGLVSGLIMFSKKQNDVSEAANNAATNISNETEELKKLFDVAKDETRSKEERAAAIKSINDNYGTYLDTMLTEKTSVEELATAYDTLTTAINNKYIAQLKEDALKGKEEVLDESKQNITDYVLKLLEKNGVSEYKKGAALAEIEKILKNDSTGDALSINSKIWSILGNKEYGGIEANAWQNGNMFSYAQSFVIFRDNLKDATKAVQNFADGYSSSMKKTEDSTDDTVKNQAKSLDDLIANIKAKEKEIEALYKDVEKNGYTESYTGADGKVVKGTTDNIEKLKGDLESLTDLYKDLTGKTWGKETEEEKIKKEAEKLLDMKRRMSEQEIDLVNQTNDAEIEAREEGLEKTLAQIENNFEKQKANLDKIKADWVKGNREVYKDNPEMLNEEGLTASQSDTLKAAYAKAEAVRDAEEQKAKKNQRQRQEESQNEYLRRYGTYEEKKLAITKEYAEKIREAREDEKDEFKAKSLEKEMDSELFNLDLSGLEDLKAAFGDIETMTKGRMVEALDTLEEHLAQATDPEQIKIFQDQINGLNAALNDEWSKGFTTDWETAIKAMKESKSYAEKAKTATGDQKKMYEDMSAKLEEDSKNGFIGAGINTFLSGLDKAVGMMKELAEASGDVSLAETAGQLDALSKNFSAAANGAASGGWVGAIIGGVTDIISQTINAFTSAKVYAAEAERSMLDYANAVKLAKFELNDDAFSSMFGEQTLQKAKAAGTVLQDVTKEYQEYVGKAMSGISAKQKEGAGGAFILPGIGAAIDMALDSSRKGMTQYEQQVDAMRRGLTELQAMSIKTRDRSGWAEFWGAEDEYSSLVDIAPDLWGEDGMLNVENAKRFLDTNTQITEQQRGQIQYAIELKEKYDESIQTIEDAVSNFVNGLSDQMAEQLWDGVISGEGAWDEWREVGEKTIASLGKQIISEMIQTAWLSQYKDRLIGAFGGTSGESPESVMNDLFSNLGSLYSTSEEFAKKYQEWLREKGYNLDEEEVERSSSQKGIAQASQESVDENNARLTTIQGHTYQLVSIQEATRLEITGIRGIADSIRENTLLSLNLLRDISTNTLEIASVSKQIRGLVDDIQRQGLKLKQ